MGRRNRRDGEHQPLPSDIEIPRPPRALNETREQRDERLMAEAKLRRERDIRRADKLITATVNWDVCCIPGCDMRRAFSIMDRSFQRDASENLPICERHQVMIAKQAVPSWCDPDVVAARERLADAKVKRQKREEDESDLLHQSDGATQGQIYFIRLNGLIKVGWSKRLRDRIKSYGASAEVLAHYPASRQEETDMHRTLRPYLARGREWYHECRLLDDMVAAVIAKHGEPTIEALWTEPKRAAVRPKGWPAA